MLHAPESLVAGLLRALSEGSAGFAELCGAVLRGGRT